MFRLVKTYQRQPISQNIHQLNKPTKKQRKFNLKNDMHATNT